MKNSRAIRRLWAPAVIAGALALALVAALFRAPTPPRSPTISSAKPTLSLGPSQGASSDPLFSEDAALNDPTPLFLPTQWNSTQKEAPLRASDIAFTGYEPKFAFGATDLNLSLPPATSVPSRPAEALVVNPPGHPYLGLGRTSGTVQALSPRGAYIEIVAAGSGQQVLSQPLVDLPSQVADSPPGEGAWQFMAAVDVAGLVGPLIQTVRSGTPSDGFFLDYLSQKLRVGERLPPGLYRISVGP